MGMLASADELVDLSSAASGSPRSPNIVRGRRVLLELVKTSVLLKLTWALDKVIF